jgi:hypothetical protein
MIAHQSLEEIAYYTVPSSALGVFGRFCCSHPLPSAAETQQKPSSKQADTILTVHSTGALCQVGGGQPGTAVGWSIFTPFNGRGRLLIFMHII